MESAVDIQERRGSDVSDVSVYFPTSTGVGERTSRAGEQAEGDNLSAISDDEADATGELDGTSSKSSSREEWYDTAEGDGNDKTDTNDNAIGDTTAGLRTKVHSVSTTEQRAKQRDIIADYIAGLPMFPLLSRSDTLTEDDVKALAYTDTSGVRVDAGGGNEGTASSKANMAGEDDIVSATKMSGAAGTDVHEGRGRNALDGDDARPNEADLKEVEEGTQRGTGRSWLSRSMGFGSGIGSYARRKWADSREAWSSPTSLFSEIGTRLTSWPGQLAKTIRRRHKDDDFTQGRKVNTQDMGTDTDRLPEVTHGVIRKHTGNTVRSQSAQVYQMPDPVPAGDEETPTLSQRTGRASWSISSMTWKTPRPVRAISQSLKSGYSWLASKLSRNSSRTQDTAGRNTLGGRTSSILADAIGNVRARVTSCIPGRSHDPSKPWSTALQKRMEATAQNRVEKGRATEDDDGLSVAGHCTSAAQSQESVIDVDYLPLGCIPRSGPAGGTTLAASFSRSQGNSGHSSTTETDRNARHAAFEERSSTTERLSTYASRMLLSGRKYWQLHRDESLAKELARQDLMPNDRRVVNKRTGTKATSSQIQKAVLNTAARQRRRAPIVRFA